MTQSRSEWLPLALFLFVVFSTLIQLPFIWDLDGRRSVLNLGARFWGFATMLGMFFFSLVLLTRQARSRASTLSRLEMVLLAMVFLFVAVRSFVHRDLAIALYGLGWLLSISFLAALLFAARADVLRLDRLWGWLGLLASIHVVIFIAAVVMYWGDADHDWRYQVPAFNNIRNLGFLTAPAAAAAAFLYLAAERGRVWHLVVFVLSFGYLLLTGSRGGVAAVGAAIPIVLVAMVFWQVRFSWRRVWVLATLTIASFIAIYLLPPMPFDTIWSRKGGLLEAGKDITTGRLELWMATLDMLPDYWLFGAGPVPWSLLPGAPERFSLNHPHNVILQVLLQWGAVGTFLMAALAWLLVRPVLSLSAGQIRRHLPAIAVLVTMFLHGQVDGNLFILYSVAIFIIALAELAHAGRHKEGRAADIAQ